MTGEPYSLPTFTMSEYNYYRLDDRIFWTCLLAGLIFCLVHAARRAFRQPLSAQLPGEGSDQRKVNAKTEEIQRYTLFQRIYHWSNALAIIVLTLSGWMIYRPIGLPALEGSAFDWFFWHRWASALFLVSLAFHLFYESYIVKGLNPVAISRAEMRHMSSVLKNFFGLSPSYPLFTKYNPGQIIFHWIVAVNLFLLILTGGVIWKPLRHLLPLALFGLGWNFIFYNRLLHGFFAATLIASLIGHIYFALFIKKNWPETKSMLTGRISLREYGQSHSLSE